VPVLRLRQAFWLFAVARCKFAAYHNFSAAAVLLLLFKGASFML
jgi:hypothetical protein